MANNQMTPSGTLLTARGVRVGQGDNVVLNGVDLDIQAGEIFGIVGRARSGKTALLETLIGLRPPLAGTVTLLGNTNPASIEVRQHVGSSLRPSTVERRTTVEEALKFCASLYDRQVDIGALMREVGLVDARSKYRERLAPHEMALLSLAMGLVSNPKVLFADEPTRELDPAGRHQAWDVLRSRRSAGTAIVLSTNMMDEAERLCDRIAVLGGGRVLAVDAPARLVSAGGAPGRMTIETKTTVPREALAGLPGVGDVIIDGTTARLVITDPVAALQAVSAVIRNAGWELSGLRLAQATLEDRLVELMQGDPGTSRSAAQA
jgi:ABC-2 type transport system ATP-binding protein